MTLNQEIKDLIRLALDSHVGCAHNTAELCYALTLVEVGLRRENPLSDEEYEASRPFIADCILEKLILRGLIEPVGIDNETGDFYLGLTSAGEAVYEQHAAQESEDQQEKNDGGE